MGGQEGSREKSTGDRGSAGGHSQSLIPASAGLKEDEKLRVKDGGIGGDGGPSEEMGNSCRAGWQLRITSPRTPGAI